MEGIHIKDLKLEDLGGEVDVVVVDVSFISLSHVFQKAYDALAESGVIVALVKPQFEAGKEHIKKGVITDELVHRHVLEDVRTYAIDAGFKDLHSDISPIEGGDGNKEFLLYAVKKV
jgi:23S rRNA (cytidine1920-2'-O)/16S rRNA (cytidine1409-2'-O)-methyltransferase